MHIEFTNDIITERLGGVNGQLNLCGTGLTAESLPHVLAFLGRYGELVGSLELDFVRDHPRPDGGFSVLDLTTLCPHL
jgi:hypothetical protein